MAGDGINGALECIKSFFLEAANEHRVSFVVMSCFDIVDNHQERKDIMHVNSHNNSIHDNSTKINANPNQSLNQKPNQNPNQNQNRHHNQNKYGETILHKIESYYRIVESTS